MKALYESILNDIDSQMINGDKWSKTIEKEISKFLKFIGSAYNYRKMGGYNISRIVSIKGTNNIEDILNVLGFDGNYIELYIINSNPYDITPEWVLTVSIRAWSKTIFPNDTYITDPNTFIKELIRPLTKDIDTFKKFLNNMEKFNNQRVNMSDLLK